MQGGVLPNIYAVFLHKNWLNREFLLVGGVLIFDFKMTYQSHHEFSSYVMSLLAVLTTLLLLAPAVCCMCPAAN